MEPRGSRCLCRSAGDPEHISFLNDFGFDNSARGLEWPGVPNAVTEILGATNNRKADFTGHNQAG